MSTQKSKKDAGPSALDAIANGLIAKQMNSGRQMGPVEFVENIVDAFDLTPFLSQRVLFKSIYGEELDNTVRYSLCGVVDGACTGSSCTVDHSVLFTEEELMDQWVAHDKSNWRHPDVLHTEVNVLRLLEGKRPKKHFNFQNITFQAGMRSSKSSAVALLCVYEFFKHITSDNPQKDLGVPKASSIYITVIASTEQQVKGTIFWYVREYITKSSFFKAKIDSGEIEVTDLQIQCREKGVIIACGHSRATSIVGRTAVMVAFDELAMFSADDGHTSNAQDVYSRVGKSTATYKHHAKRIALSSVKCEGDFMETLVRDDWDRQAQGCLVFNLPTFDFNPLLDKDEAGIASDYAKDPASAARDYENVRPGTIGAFFIPEVVDRTCVKDPATVIMSQPEKIFRRRGEALSVDGQVLAHDSEDDVREMSGLQVAVTPVMSMLTETYGFCDIGLKHDSFGFAFGHVEWSEAGTRYVVDGVLEWRPRFLGKNKWALVDMVNSEEVILEVARKRNMTRLAYDQWNAASSVQRLFRENVITTQMPFSQPFQKKIYDNLRKKMNAGMVELPNLPVLVEELKNIELKNNESIQHPKSKDSTVLGHGKISKDLADVVAGLVWTLTQAFDADGALPPQSTVQAGPISSSVYSVGHSQANLMQSKLRFFGTRG